MKRTFQSFVFGCRVNEAERIQLDRELMQAGFSVDLASPAFIIINTCAITGKAEREAKQLIYQLRKRNPEAKIVITGCSATLWQKYGTESTNLADIIVPNAQKSKLISLLSTPACRQAGPEVAMAQAGRQDAPVVPDKFRRSNRLLVKIQDGCHRFCSYCIVPYLRGTPQSTRIKDIVGYINSFDVVPSEVVLSAINTEAFGKDTGEDLIELIKAVLKQTKVPRIAFGSIHPWSLTDDFIEYYRTVLSSNPRFVQFFHVPIQSGSQTVLKLMRREYDIKDIISRLHKIQTIRPDALLATDVIVGYLGETDELFKETVKALKDSPISRFHVFRFSNRAHTAAYYLKKQLVEPDASVKKERSEILLDLSSKKVAKFMKRLVGSESNALAIAPVKEGTKILLHNHIEAVLAKNVLPGNLVHVTIVGAQKKGVVCKES